MTREEFYTLTLRGLAVSFAVVGSLFVLAPDGTIRVLNAVGGALGSFTPAPESALRFWLSLGAAYMVLVTLLAWVAQRDLRRHRDLLWILAAGKAVSSLTCLVYYLFSMDAFVYLANFVVDGSIALTAIKIWVDVPHLGDPSRVAATPKSAGDESASEPGSVRDALLEALVPAGGPFPEGGSTPEVSAAIDEFVTASGRSGVFQLGLRFLDLSPFLVPPLRFKRFSRLPLEDRVRLLEAWESSRLWPRRQVLHMFKLVALTHVYDRPEIKARLRYPNALERVPLEEPAVSDTAT
jgi:hypothetical protein